MKKLFFLVSMLFGFIVTSNSCNNATSPNNDNSPLSKTVTTDETESNKRSNTKIQIAILLDTSSKSMDGLIEQAKSRLWNIVNTLTTLKYRGQTPTIEIALYEYGNDNITADDYVRQITPLTNDLDLISEKLFGLTTNGGLELCAAVIAKATKNLQWGNNEDDIKLIYIAGNEEFNQGSFSYKTAINNALEKGIYINTIYCGNPEAGIRELWADAAKRGKGKYFNINHNAKVRYIATPYDDRINSCNIKLNDTYIPYGSSGARYKENQSRQDLNAKSMSSANSVERSVSKTKAIYKNDSWDMVDKVKEDKDALKKIKKEDLPTELQTKSTEEIQKIIAEKQKERDSLQKEIAELAKKRQAYIDEEMKKEPADEKDFGAAINNSIIELAKTKGYTVDK